MANKFRWKGEISFHGTDKEFAKLAAVLDSYPVRVEISEWRIIDTGHLAGCNRIAVDKLLQVKNLNEIIAEQPRFKPTFIKDIRGGIRSPHLHLGDEVVLLNRDRFKMMVGKVAAALAEARVDKYTDYINVVGRVNDLADEPVRIRQVDLEKDTGGY